MTREAVAGALRRAGVHRVHADNLKYMQLGYAGMPWPVQYLSGKQQLERNLARAALAANDAPEANG